MKRRTPATAVVAVLLLAGCGSSSQGAAPQAGDSPSSTASAATTPGGSGGGAPKAGTKGGSPKAPSGGGGTAPGSGPSASAAATAGGAAATTAYTAPGRYTYDAHGTVTAGTPRKIDGTAELDVDKPSGDRQHSSLGGDQGGTEQDVLHRSTGTYLVRLALTTSGEKKEFRPATPVLAAPRPAAVGRAWSWSMTSTDGKTHAAFDGRIVRRETVTIGGTQVPTWVIDATLRLTGDITYTDHETIWYDETRLLQVKTRSQGSGKVGGIAFTTDTTSTLRSVKPS